MRIELQQAPEQVAVLAPSGRLDAASAPAFRECVRELVASGARDLVVDLGDVPAVDSGGLAALIGGLKEARHAGGSLRLARPNEQVLTLLDVTSLTRVFRPYGSVEEVLAGSEAGAAHTVKFRAGPEALQVVHEALGRFWEGVAVPDERWRMMFELAVFEIAANVVEHARPPLIQLSLLAEPDRVAAEFVDSGRPWSGSPAPPTLPDDLAEGGRGLALAWMAVDEVAYERLGERNHWRLVKRRSPRAAVEGLGRSG